MQTFDETSPGDGAASRGIDRRHLLGLVTATLAAGIIPEAWLAEAAYGLYEKFRPQIPPGKRGWGQEGTLDLALIRSLHAKAP